MIIKFGEKVLFVSDVPDEDDAFRHAYGYDDCYVEYGQIVTGESDCDQNRRQ